MEDNFVKAKNLFVKRYYSLKYLNEDEKKEWESYNVPKEIIINWAKERVDSLFNDIEEQITLNNNRSYEERQKHNEWICNHFRIALHEIDEFKIDSYLEDIVSLYEKLNYDEYILFSNDYQDPFWDRKVYLINYIIRDKESKDYFKQYDECFNAFSYYYYFDGDDRFIGILPKLIHNKELYNRMINICLDIIENIIDSYCVKHYFIKDLYNYSRYIQDNTLLTKIRDSVIISKNKFLTYGYITDELFQEIHTEPNKKIEIAKISYYSSLILNREYNYPLHVLSYSKINQSIIDAWKLKLPYYILSIFNNIDNYLSIQTNDLINNIHSNNYIQYLKNKTLNRKICLIETLISYYLETHNNIDFKLLSKVITAIKNKGYILDNEILMKLNQ